MSKQTYESLRLDGKMIKLNAYRDCEWCGKTIPKKQVAVYRNYKLDTGWFTTYMHLTCYDKARTYCAKYGHTFERFTMRPIQYLRLGMHPDTLKGVLGIYDAEKECANKYILDVTERHNDTMEPILY